MFKPIKSSSVKTGQTLSLLTAIIWLTLLSPLDSFSAPEDATTGDIKDENGEIQIQSDYMKFDLETGSSIYEGNVRIIQGTIKLTGDKVIVTRKDNDIHEIHVDGDPARYLQDEASANKVDAISQHMEYATQTHRLVLTVDATLEQTDHTVVSQRIVYDTQNKVILAGKSSSSDQTGDRVKTYGRPGIVGFMTRHQRSSRAVTVPFVGRLR